MWGESLLKAKKSINKNQVTSPNIATKVATSPETDTLYAAKHMGKSTSRKEYPFGSIVEICEEERERKQWKKIWCLLRRV